MTEIEKHCIYNHAVLHKEHILMGITVGECCTWDSRITIPLLQPVVRTVTTIFSFNFQRLISTLFVLTLCRCSILMNDMEYWSNSSRGIAVLNTKGLDESRTWINAIIIYICGNKMPSRCNRGFYCRSYCLLNMFRAPLCPSSGAQEYYTMVAACGIWCFVFKFVGLVWSWRLCVRFAGCCSAPHKTNNLKTTARNTTGSNHCIILLSSW